MAHTLKVYCDRFLSLIETFIRLKVIHRSSYKIDIYSINWSNSRWSRGKNWLQLAIFSPHTPPAFLFIPWRKLLNLEISSFSNSFL